MHTNERGIGAHAWREELKVFKMGTNSRSWTDWAAAKKGLHEDDVSFSSQQLLAPL